MVDCNLLQFKLVAYMCMCTWPPVYQIGLEHRWQSRGDRGVHSTPKQTFGPPTQVFMPKNTFTDVFDTGDIDGFRGHIFCPQTTQELPKKHNEARGQPQKDCLLDTMN